VCTLLFVSYLAGCATSPQIRLLLDDPPDIPPRMELTEVPFFPQQEYHCGPAALAGVMNYQGVEVMPDQIADLIYVPGLKGSLQVEVVAAVRRLGLLPVELDGSLESLLREVAAANPVFLLQNLGLDIYPVWHYEILIGYDLERRLMILRSGVNRRITRSFFTFEQTWQRAGRWALVIVNADSIPVSASADAYLDAVIGMEQAGSMKIARLAYTTALRRWPENPVALGGLGNSAYALGDYADAERAYRAVLARDPARAELWNNLAYALMQLGKRESALAAIARARLLDPGNSNYLDSQRELDNWP
jgi:tetratricopeptide (TPR) repeat protein